MTPLVTYVVNTFNRPAEVVRAIDSILNQDYKNIEILVVDDCSTKNINLGKYGADAHNIRYIRNTRNIGLSRSREVGLVAASSDIVCFLDDDDVLLDETKTTRHLRLLMSNEKIALVCSNIQALYKNGDRREGHIEWPADNRLLKHFFSRNGIVYPSTTMVRRAMILNVGGFDPRFSRGVDSDVYRRLLMKGYKFIFDERCTVLYLAEAEDKITDNRTVDGIKKDILSNLLTLRKYWICFLMNPNALTFRLKVVVKGSVKLGLNLLRLR